MKQQLLRGLCLLFVCLATAFASSTMLTAQELATHPIAVQRANGKVDYYDDINKAFSKLTANAIVYISEGTYTLSSADSVKIKVPVAIYGSGSTITETNKIQTRVIGTIYFAAGAKNSVLMGVYMNNGIYSSANNVLIKGVNANSIGFAGGVKGCAVASCIVRQHVYGSDTPILLSNSLVGYIGDIDNSIIKNCVLGTGGNSSYDYYYNAYNLHLSSCIGMDSKSGLSYKSSHAVDHCMLGTDGDIPYPEGGLSSVFKKYDSKVEFYNLQKQDYRLAKSIKGADGTDIGLYGGAGFDPNGGSPIPRFTLRKVADKTDKDGKLRVQIQIIAE